MKVTKRRKGFGILITVKPIGPDNVWLSDKEELVRYLLEKTAENVEGDVEVSVKIVKDLSKIKL